MVALGDSITVGVGDSVGSDAVHGPGWAAHLAALLRTEAFTNLATNGARVRDVRRDQLPRALALRPTLATVFAGGNDVLRSDFDAREVERDLRATVTALRTAGTDVVLATLPRIGLFELAPSVVRAVVRRRVAAVNAAVSTVDPPRPGRDLPGRLLVVDSVAAVAPAGRGAWHIDRVHPSPAGHRQLALTAAAALGEPADVGPGLADRLPAAPPPPTLPERVAWLVTAGVPWCVRRGGDFLPGLVRAVVADLRAERELVNLLVHRRYTRGPSPRPKCDTPEP
ncbi:SGNH/GDSL hydrolase family protein [Antribacter gilvus]|uniref:SGNH/GDSL hydrolase family protein n=1 Tax=Antribacter gilvus TaxID=2304675 RepID=UPI001F0CC508|nr:SGNH/GDSL hydrolase family protein [Antribacter gilvus]